MGLRLRGMLRSSLRTLLPLSMQQGQQRQSRRASKLLHNIFERNRRPGTYAHLILLLVYCFYW